MLLLQELIIAEQPKELRMPLTPLLPTERARTVKARTQEVRARMLAERTRVKARMLAERTQVARTLAERTLEARTPALTTQMMNLPERPRTAR